MAAGKRRDLWAVDEIPKKILAQTLIDCPLDSSSDTYYMRLYVLVLYQERLYEESDCSLQPNECDVFWSRIAQRYI